MTATHTISLAEARESYAAMVARYPQYEREASMVRPVRATMLRLSAGEVVGFQPGDIGLGYYKPSILAPGSGEWTVYSARTGWHFGGRYGFAYVEEA